MLHKAAVVVACLASGSTKVAADPHSSTGKQKVEAPVPSPVLGELAPERELALPLTGVSTKGGAFVLPRHDAAEVCPWRTPHRSGRSKALCEDGAYVADWQCVEGGHGNRTRCPIDLPVMCVATTCGAGNEHCCEADCTDFGGERPCEEGEAIWGGEVEVNRGILQRLTDPGNLQEPWQALLYLLGDVYIFFCLHTVVHSRFEPAMGRIVDLSGMNEDMAGATLLAIGTSFPEVLSGAVGVFVPGAGEAGLGTVVGSLVFNMLVITGSVIVVYTQHEQKPLVLSKSATIRDVGFQVATIMLLVWAFSDHQANVSNVVVFLLFYVVYIVVCGSSAQIAECCRCDGEPSVTKVAFQLLPAEAEMQVGSYDTNREKTAEHADDEHGKAITLLQKPRSGTKVAFQLLPVEAEIEAGSYDTTLEKTAEHADDEHGKHAPKTLAELWVPGKENIVLYILSLPIKVLETALVLTVPDVGSPIWEERQLSALVLNLSMCCMWLGILVLFMIQWATKAGELLGIEPAIMGITFCAAGTSVPDCMVSIIVAKQGKGNMAISNVFGSNVFDILIAMAVPWALNYAVYGTENLIQMEAEGFGSAIAILALVLLFYVCCVCIFRLSLPKGVGYLHLSLYVVFVAYVFLKNMAFFKESIAIE